MSFQELAISIVAENLASAEFNRISADAARMGEGVRASAAGFNELAVASRETAEGMGEVDSQTRASARGFDELKGNVEATTVSLRSVAMAFSSVVSFGSAITSLAGDLGIADKESAKWARTILTVITLTAAWIRMKAYLTTITTGHTAAISINTTAQSSNASASISSAVAYKVKAAATWIAVHAQNALNISHATFLALTGVGIGVIIAAAAAMAYFASQMNAATSSIKEYNTAIAETPTRTRGITRAGEEEMYRRGVE